MIATATILNVYQAAFSSEFAITFPYATSWRYLLELDNFTIYLLVNDNLCKQYGSERKAETILLYESCLLDNLLFPECQIIHKLALIMDRGTFLAQNQAQANVASRLLGTSRLLCNNHEQIHKFSTVNDPVGRASSAFLTYDYEFQHNWCKFVKIMESNPSLKYAHNLDVDDDFGVTFTGYVFTDGLHAMISNGVIGRFERLMSSGIYWLWERWDRIRFSQNRAQREARISGSDRELPRALSFENSGTPWLFGVQIVASMGALFIFLFEKLGMKILVHP